MYLQFYGFDEKPFTITPNPRFIFLSKTHREVFAHLLYGLRQQSGFIELTGEVGTGKTTVLRTLMGQLDKESYRLAYIFNPSLSPLDLLHCIHREFGLETPAESAAAGLDRLNAFLLAENAAGRTVVLVIDEAQNLPPAVLEQIRLLSNLETEAAKLIQIVLAGQPELEELLSRPELRQLNQRITVRYRLQSLDFEDTDAYIRHRLKVAAGGEKVDFAAAAVRRIFRYSRGLPRLINILCDRALLVGYTEEAREITHRHVRTAHRELQRETGGRRWRAAWWGVPALALLGGALWLLPGYLASRPAAAPATVVSPLPSPVKPALPAAARLPELRRQLAEMDEGENAAVAFNALAPLWEARPVRTGGTLQIPLELRQVVETRGLQLTSFQGDLQILLRLDSPALLEIAIPGLPGWRYLAVTRIVDGRAHISPSLVGEDSLPLEELGQLWFGRGYLLWRNFLGLPNLTLPGTAGEPATQLQELLAAAGLYQGIPTGIFDAATIDAVTRFQAARGIAQDGRVGPQTLLLLYQADARFAVPRISGAGGEET